MKREDENVSRRDLLSFFKRSTPEAERKTTGGSERSASFLDAFYDDRASKGNATGAIPPVRLRAGLAATPTSKVGVPELADPVAPSLSSGSLPGIASLSVGGRPWTVPGRLRVHQGRCLAWQGVTCTACVDHCPEQGAIRVDGGRPSVIDERCTRCGICIAVCPAPINAFEVSAESAGEA